MKKLWKMFALVLAAALFLAACGSDDDEVTADDETTTTVEETATTEPAETTEPEEETTEPVEEMIADPDDIETPTDNFVELFAQLDIAGYMAPDCEADDAEEGCDPTPVYSDDEVAEGLAAAVALIEGGEDAAVADTVPLVAGLAAAAGLEIIIDEAAVIDGNTATYVFSATSFGNPTQLEMSNGISVYEDGEWKLSGDIWAAFVSMGGGAGGDDSDGEVGPAEDGEGEEEAAE